MRNEKRDRKEQMIRSGEKSKWGGIVGARVE